MIITMINMSQSTVPKTKGAAVSLGLSVGVGVDVPVTGVVAEGAGVDPIVGTGVDAEEGSGVSIPEGGGVNTPEGTGVNSPFGFGFTVTATALESGEVTGVEAPSVTLQKTECEVPSAV
jgi:hypothetical protein